MKQNHLKENIKDILETEHLILRNWQESDAQDLYRMCLDEDLRKSGIDSYTSAADSRNAIASWMNDQNFKAIVSKESLCFLGFICLGDMNRYEGYKELEYAIAPEYRSRGYATEAVKCMVDYGFRELDLSVIASYVRSHNKCSIRVLEKCSFTFEGRLRKHARDKSDTLCYSVLKEDWERT